MIVTKVLCDNCGKEIDGSPFVILKVGKSPDSHYCFECSKVFRDEWTVWNRVVREHLADTIANQEENERP